LKIRVFKPQDIKQVVSLANEYASFDSDVAEVDFQPAMSFPGGLLVAEDDKQLVGLVFSYIREVPGEILSRWDVSKVAQIEVMVVAPSYRGQGIGKALLDRLLETLREKGVDLVLLHCPVESKEAKHLYDKLGFEVRAYAMKKRL
jgi:ribosomal protein S18 acetylase RimI-like enzyme